MMKINNLIEVIREFREIESICEDRGEEKLEANNEGFGRDNMFESLSILGSGAEVIFVDNSYDLRRTVEIYLTLEEICMSDDEWNKSIKIITDEREAKEKEKMKLREIKKKEQRRKDFEALKVEFENQIS